MITPTVVHAAYTVDLGYPAGEGSRTLDERAVTRRTLSGSLRTSLLSYSYTYRLDFAGVLRADYDRLVELWLAAVAAGAFPRFTFTDVWPTAYNVPVALEIGPLVWDVPGTDEGSYSLVLAEAEPR